MIEHSLLLAEGFHLGFLLLVGVFIAVAIIIRLSAGSMDKDRIEQYLRARSYEPLEITWEPFGRGFWGEKNDRIYWVRYRDADGQTRRAWCKTNLWGGVYLSDDDIVTKRKDNKGPARQSESPSAVDQLERENQKLREELDRLKRDRELNER